MDASAVARQARGAFDDAQQTLSTRGTVAADFARVQALEYIRAALEAARSEIQAANARDVDEARAGQLSKQLVARLDLFSKPGKWDSMIQGVSDVARLPSPLDVCTRATRLADTAPATATRPAAGALDLYRMTCPIGVLLCLSLIHI